jgi:membrane protease YdiL (CAAX protease family)
VPSLRALKSLGFPTIRLVRILFIVVPFLLLWIQYYLDERDLWTAVPVLVGMIGVLLFGYYFHPSVKTRLFFRIRPIQGWRGVLAVIIWCLGCGLLQSAVTSIWILFSPESAAGYSRNLPALSGEDVSRAALVAFQVARFCGVVVVAPLLEELLFRGILQPFFVKRLGPVIGIAVVAFVFAAVHQNAQALPTYLAIAFALGCLAYYSRSIWPGVILHAWTNLQLIPVIHLDTPVESFSEALLHPVLPINVLFLVAAKICFDISLLLLYQDYMMRHPRFNASPVSPEKEVLDHIAPAAAS